MKTRPSSAYPFLFFLAGLLWMPALHSQEFVAFPKDSAQWIYQAYSEYGTLTGMRIHSIQGDTIIDGKLYSKYYDEHQHVCGFIREDSNLIFFLPSLQCLPSQPPSTTGEVVWMDYNLLEGDTFVFPPYQEGLIDPELLITTMGVIDSIQLLDGTYRRRWNFDLVNGQSSLFNCEGSIAAKPAFTEGIGHVGSNDPEFDNVSSPLYFLNQFFRCHWFRCLVIGGITILGDCTVSVTGIPSRSAGPLLYPNPMIDGLLYTDYEHPFLWRVETLHGQVYDSGRSNGMEAVRLTGISSGYYLFRMITEKGEVFVSKLIVINP